MGDRGIALVASSTAQRAVDLGGSLVVESSASVGNAIAWVGHQATGEKGWFGWPTDEAHEKLRDKWAAAGNLEEQKAVAREMQKNDWDFVPHIWLGQFLSPVAYRKNLRGVLALPEVIPFWNMEKG